LQKEPVQEKVASVNKTLKPIVENKEVKQEA
jgi:hypothetical protein